MGMIVRNVLLGERPVKEIFRGNTPLWGGGVLKFTEERGFVEFTFPNMKKTRLLRSQVLITELPLHVAWGKNIKIALIIGDYKFDENVGDFTDEVIKPFTILRDVYEGGEGSSGFRAVAAHQSFNVYQGISVLYREDETIEWEESTILFKGVPTHDKKASKETKTVDYSVPIPCYRKTFVKPENRPQVIVPIPQLPIP